MRSVNGKTACEIDAATVAAWAANYRQVIVDLGTGDGHFVRHLAQGCPERAVIGVDTCQTNLRQASRRAPKNALFVVADALSLPGELHRLATGVTINFPWGSLLTGLLDGHTGLLDGLRAVGRDGIPLAVTLNGGALTEAGWQFEAGGERVAAILAQSGFRVRAPRLLEPEQMRRYPTTWAKRLVFGRDPRMLRIAAVLHNVSSSNNC